MKVLLVRTSSMGDLIHTLPAIEDLSRHRPDIQLHWLCEEAFSDIARLHPFVRKIHLFSWRQWRKKLFSTETRQHLSALKKALMAEKFDLVLDSQGLLKSALAGKLAGAPIVGMDKHSAREGSASYFYRQKYSVPKNHNAIWRNRTLFATAFGYSFHETVSFGVQLPTASAVIDCDSAYHVCLTAASRENKLWLPENWAELWQKMYETDGLPCYLPYGNQQEKERVEALAVPFSFVHVCPKISLMQAAILLRGAKSVIGVDTGLLHLANAVGSPLLGIFISTNPQKTGVQESPIAKNIGNIDNTPDVQAAFQLWINITQTTPKP